MISFIVPAYNEERLLPATLRALHATATALGEPYEIIVADDASSDGTVAVARAAGARVIHLSRRQIAAARNAGAREARGDRLAFVDADTLVDETLMRAALQALRVGAVGGGAGVRFEGRVPFYARLLLPAVVRTFRVFGWASGCFVFCTRAAFEASGGFDETLYASEEIAISRALKQQGRFVVLRETVTTSGRRIRAYPAAEALGILARLALSGPRAMRSRQSVSMWYDDRREDPDV